MFQVSKFLTIKNMIKPVNCMFCFTELKSVKEKIIAYRELLERLSLIEYQTLRKLLGHLNFIQSQSGRNKMSVSNLALIWGVTLLRRNKVSKIEFKYYPNSFLY